MATPKVINWIRKQLRIEEGADPVARLVLRHQTPTTPTGADIHTVRLPSKIDGEPDAQIGAWADELEGAAQDDADGLPGQVQTYIIYSFGRVDRELRKPLSRCPLRVSKRDMLAEDGGDAYAPLARYGSGNRGGGELDSEPPTPMGLVSQLMRHNEALMKMAVLGSQQSLNNLSRENSRLMDQSERGFERQLEFVRLSEEMQSQKVEREAASFEAASKEARKNEFFQKIMMLAPTVINRIAKAPILPETTTPLTEMIDGFGSSLRDEQIGKLMSILSADQQITLVEILQTIRKKQEAEAQDRPTPPGQNGAAKNGEAHS